MSRYRIGYLLLAVVIVAAMYSCSYGDAPKVTIDDVYPVDGDVDEADKVDGDISDPVEEDMPGDEEAAEETEPELPDTSIDIPDGDPTGLYLVRVVTEDFEVHRVRLVMDATHPASEELFITLTSPAGTSRVIRPVGTVHEVNMHLDQVLFDFQGEQAAGDWTVRVVDTVPGNAGAVTYWALQFMFAPPADEDEYEEPEAEPEIEEEEEILWQDIPDNDANGVTMTFQGPDEGLVSRVIMLLDVEHTFEGDLEIHLQAPNGDSKKLLSSMSQAERIIPEPINTNLFAGYEAAGLWTIVVADVVPGDTGRVRLLSAEIQLAGGDEDDIDTEVVDTDPDIDDVQQDNSIPDNDANGLSRTFYIETAETVGQVRATVSVEHPRHTDLQVYATNPVGERVEMQRTLQSTGSLLQLRTYSFYGQSSGGLWVLTVVDTVAGQEGTLLDAELFIDAIADGDVDEEEDIVEVEPEIEEELDDVDVDDVVDADPEVDIIDFDDGRDWIPDNDANGITLSVVSSLDDLAGNVCLDIAFVHPFTKDLTIDIISPAATRLTVLESGSNLPTPNLDHRFATDVFADENAAGTWLIHIADVYEGDIGYVASYALSFNCDVQIDGDVEEELEDELEEEIEEELEPEVEMELEEIEYIEGGNCEAPVEILFPSTIHVEVPQGAQNELTPASSCAGWTFDGPETVFQFEVKELRPHFFTVTSETDYGLYIVKDCANVYSCIQGIDAVEAGSELLTFKPGAMGIYYLVVDTTAADADPQPFELFSFTCIKEIYESTETPVAIPDNNVMESTIDIPVNFIIDKMDLQVDITHPYAGDIVLQLDTPWGESSIIRSRQGGGEDNIHDIYQLWKFHGNRAAGTWKLTVTDASTGSTGTLDGWNLRFYCDPEVEGCDIEAEPPHLCTDDNGHNLNDRPCRAMEIDLPYVDSGYVCRTRRLSEDMDDFYGFWLDPGDTITVTATMPNEGDNVDVYLHGAPYDKYNPLVQAAGSDNPEVLEYTANMFGYYWLRLRTAVRDTEATYDLVIDIEKPQVDGDTDDDVPAVDLSVPGCEINDPPAQCTNDAGNNQNNIPCRALYVNVPYFASDMYVCDINDEEYFDWYAFYLDAGQEVTVTADFSSQYDIDMYLYDEPPETLYGYVRSATSVSEPEVLTYDGVEEFALYWLRVKVYGSWSSDTDAQYSITIETN